MVKWLRRWLLERRFVVADSTYAALDFLAAGQSLRPAVTVVTLCGLIPAPEHVAGQTGRPRLKGAQQPTPAVPLTDKATMSVTAS